jgi:hypothetical protein
MIDPANVIVGNLAQANQSSKLDVLDKRGYFRLQLCALNQTDIRHAKTIITKGHPTNKRTWSTGQTDDQEI